MRGIKRAILMTVALVAFVASADSFSFLAFTKTNGSTLFFSTDNIKLSYDATSVYITNDDGTEAIALSDLANMYFSNDAVPIGDVNSDGEVNIADVNTVIDAILSDNHNMNCDVNGDYEVNIADINAIIDIILSH